ncbi:cytochrome c biogenesis protein CcsA, partial [Vibrio vulnificus]|nr:cytochrome c biogenesis protein CcsA [Vibrio vulnificus]
VFAIYFHIRTNKFMQGLNSAIVASIGFLIIWICYFGVNLLGKGLHSYGSFTLTSN